MAAWKDSHNLRGLKAATLDLNTQRGQSIIPLLISHANYFWSTLWMHHKDAPWRRVAWNPNVNLWIRLLLGRDRLRIVLSLAKWTCCCFFLMGYCFLRIKMDFTYTETIILHRKMMKCWIMNRCFLKYFPKLFWPRRWWATQQYIGSVPGRHITEQKKNREMHRMHIRGPSFHWIILSWMIIINICVIGPFWFREGSKFLPREIILSN